LLRLKVSLFHPARHIMGYVGRIKLKDFFNGKYSHRAIM
jgi:hypothetical protein